MFGLAIIKVFRLDRILLTDNGKVLATGTYAELLNSNTKYRELYERYVQNDRLFGRKAL